MHINKQKSPGADLQNRVQLFYTQEQAVEKIKIVSDRDISEQTWLIDLKTLILILNICNYCRQVPAEKGGFWGAKVKKQWI